MKKTLQNTHIIDVRTVAEYNQGHVKGSLNIPLQSLEKELHKLKSLSGELILCCASGGRSDMASRLLKQQGFKNVSNGGSWLNVKATYSI